MVTEYEPFPKAVGPRATGNNAPGRFTFIQCFPVATPAFASHNACVPVHKLRETRRSERLSPRLLIPITMSNVISKRVVMRIKPSSDLHVRLCAIMLLRRISKEDG